MVYFCFLQQLFLDSIYIKDLGELLLWDLGMFLNDSPGLNGVAG